MKTETKKRIWSEVVKQLNNGLSGGKSFKLRFSRNHNPLVEIFNGAFWEIPESIIAQLTGEAKQLIDAEKDKAIAESKATAERLRKEREELEKRFDEPGFFLIAGEESEVLHSGTLRECRDNLWKVTAGDLPRDPYCGIGCWVIAKGGEEVMSGKFDRDCYY
jgi:hypothetical protein